MSEPRVGIGATLDDAADVVARIAAPWLGALWLGGIPVRLLQAQLAERVLELGKETRDYGDALRPMALGITAAFVLSLVCRALFCQAVWLGLRSDTAPGREVLRIPVLALVSSVAAGLLFETLFFATGPVVVFSPFFALAVGLSSANVPVLERPGLASMLREVARALRGVGTLLAIGTVLVVAFAAALLNLFVLFQLGLWLAGGFPGLDLIAWVELLSPGNPRFMLALLAGAWLLVEPFYLAVLTVFVHRLRSRESGEDLRLWFARLARAKAA